MSYVRPSLKDNTQKIENDFNTQFGGESRPLRFSVTKVISKVVAAATHLVHGRIDFAMKQIVPDSASLEYLERWALIWGIQRKMATCAEGYVIFDGSEGVSIPLKTQIQTKDSISFQTKEEGIIKDGKAKVKIQALDYSSKGNLPQNTSLNLISPIINIQSACVLAEGGTVNGTDVEEDSSLRNRLLLRIRNPICAGNKQDYINWALETPGGGVTRAWCFPQYQGDGNVGVFFVKDNQENIIPSDTEIDVVRKYIAAIMPCTARLFVKAPDPHIVNFTINTNVKDEKIKEEFRLKIEDQLKYLFLNYANPNDGDNEEVISLKGNGIKNEDILESIALIKSGASSERFRLASPKEDIILGIYEVGIVGTITLVTEI